MRALVHCPLIEPGPQTVAQIASGSKVRCESCGLVQKHKKAQAGTGSHVPCRRCESPYAVYA